MAHRAGPDRDLSVWHVTTELSDDTSVSFLMGIVREGTAIAQVGFVPDGDVTMAPERLHRARRAGRPAAARDAAAELGNSRQLACAGVRPSGEEARHGPTTLRARHAAAAVLATAALVTCPVAVVAA